ncbi:uncharacterized protein LOC135934476 [Cloeon dipterum]|uniref:uncharacterized protein LOC135934476 n=1 Tax=Cloeon dipterum TaxID=197152 RepID=UPI0032207E5C
MSGCLKRRCPFLDDASPQSKLFVTEKISLTKLTARSSQMTAVQDKTLQLLFRGANSKSAPYPPSDIRLFNNNLCVHYNEQQETSAKKQKYRQMQIGSNGQLIFAPEANVDADIDFLMSADEESKCSFCEVALKCQLCLQKCQKCLQVFCQQCCLIVCDETQDVSLCMSCMK